MSLLEDHVEHQGQGDAGADALDQAAEDEHGEVRGRGAHDRAGQEGRHGEGEQGPGAQAPVEVKKFLIGGDNLHI